MALVNCEDCNRPISRRAQACPHCGAPRGGAFGPALGVAVVLAIGGWFGWTKYEEHERARIAEMASDAKRPVATAKAPFKKSEATQRAASGAKSLKRVVRSPDGTRLQSAIVVDGSGAICYEYETPNAFGGMISGRAVLPPDSNGVVTTEMDGFQRLWSQECERKKGTQVANGINWFSL